MATRDRTMANDTGKSTAPSMTVVVAIAIATALFAGGFAGFNEARIEAGDAAVATWAAPLIVVALGVAALGLYVRRHADGFRTWSQRKRLYWASLLFSGVIGMVAAMLLQEGPGDGLMSNEALSPNVAIGLSLLWVVGLVIALALYHRAVDDHERHAYHQASLAGFYAFIFPCPVWWVLWRADLAPPVDAMALFGLVLIVNAAVYLWFKFR
jgi:drug/metabolite transporter (DMT)-like permease